MDAPTPPTPLDPHIERILDAARIAPSRDNLQPWRFLVEGDTVSFLVDHDRDRSPANAGGRMARIAVGAALECAVLRAGRMGATVRYLPPRHNALVTVSFTGAKRVVEADKALARRATNRLVYDGRPLDDATFAWLREATPKVNTVRTLWFGRERVRVLGPLVEEAESLYFADVPLREAALQAIRFDVRDREEVTRGLSVGSLELSAPERVAFDSLRRSPPDSLAAAGVFKKMGGRARRLMESASGVCVITAAGSEPSVNVTVGRCMQRAWLGLARRGLVAQPMSSTAALEARLDAGEKDGGPAAVAEADQITALLASWRAAFPSAERGSRIAVVLRFGWAPPPTVRVRRFPLEESVAAEPKIDSAT